MTDAEKIQAAFHLGRVVEKVEGVKLSDDPNFAQGILAHVAAVLKIMSDGVEVQGWDINGRAIK